MTNQTQTDKMLKTLLLHMGLYQVCDLWSAGENNGGRYVVLYNTRANYQLCKVYEEAFRKLPDFITANIDDVIAAGDVPSEKSRAEKVGRLKSCPPFAFTRWQLGGGQDEDKAKWRFGEVLWVKGGDTQAPTVHAEPEPGVNGTPYVHSIEPAEVPPQTYHYPEGQRGGVETAPPVLETWDDAIEWASNMTGWDEPTAREHMKQQWTAHGKPLYPEGLMPMWIAYVRERVK